MVQDGSTGNEVTTDDFSRLIDLKIFDPEDCKDLIHCTMSKNELGDDGYI